VIQDGLKTLLFHLSDMPKLTLKIEEDIKFQRGLNIKQFLGNFLSLQNLITISCILTFKTIAS
jgi:hypothetical protein